MSKNMKSSIVHDLQSKSKLLMGAEDLSAYGTSKKGKNILSNVMHYIDGVTQYII